MPGIITRRNLIGTTAAVGAAAALPRRARAATKPIKIGVLTDMNGPYAANTGKGSVVGAKLAVEDFMKAHPDIKVELIAADMQDKPSVVVSIATEWLDHDGVDLITDVPLSSGAIAVSKMVQQRDKAAIFTGAASAELTGKYCGLNHLHWVYDTWALPHALVGSIMKEGGTSWFFITADYVFGFSLEHDCSSFVTKDGGTLKGDFKTPFPGTTDFSAALIAARASGAKVIGLANGGADTVNCIKQAHEFGIIKGGQMVAGLVFFLPDVHGVGLEDAQGVLLASPFYWNMNASTRAFGRRFAKLRDGAMPDCIQAGQYSAVMAYLNTAAAIGVDKAKASGRAVFAHMRAHPFHDPLFGDIAVRIDGQVLHNMYLFQVKTPAESKEPWDYLNLKRTIPAAQAFRPLNESGCPLVKS